MITRPRIFLEGSPGSDTFMDLPIEGRTDPTPVPDPDDSKGSEEEEKAGGTQTGLETSDKPVAEETKTEESEGKVQIEEKAGEEKTDSDTEQHGPAKVEIDVSTLNHLKNIQSLHDKGLAVLKEKHPEAYADWMARKKGIDERFTRPDREPITPPDPAKDKDDDDNWTLEAQKRIARIAAREEMDAIAAEDRAKAEEALQKEMAAAYDQEFEDVQKYLDDLSKQTRMQDDGKTPMVQMGADGKTPLKDDKGNPMYVPLIPQEVWEKAIENVRPRSQVPGAPTDTLHDIMREIRLAMLERNLHETRAKIAAEETEKVRKVEKDLSQPARAGASTGAKKSEEMEDLDRRRGDMSGFPLDSLPE